jgi:hypothetical protein
MQLACVFILLLNFSSWSPFVNRSFGYAPKIRKSSRKSYVCPTSYLGQGATPVHLNRSLGASSCFSRPRPWPQTQISDGSKTAKRSKNGVTAPPSLNL